MAGEVLTLRVRFFAGGVQAAGLDEAQVEANPELTVAQAAQKASPNPLDKLLAVSSFLVDGQLTPGRTPLAQLNNPSTIEVLPPFAGG